jgi:hypothetical protein
MGGVGSGRVSKKLPPEPKPGQDEASIVLDPRYLATSKATRMPVPTIPEASSRWHPIVRSWYNSLKLSGQTQLWQPSDWTTAVLAADCYDRFIHSGNGQILVTFNRLSERLGVTEIDRKRARIELTTEGEVDQDKERAKKAVISWKGRLGLVHDDD